MNWLKYKLETTTEATDLVVDMLSELGICGVEVRDKVALSEEEKEKMYVDILPETALDDGKAELYFYVELPSDEGERSALYNSGTEVVAPLFLKEEDLRNEIERGLEELSAFVDIGSGKLSVTPTDDMKWADKWKDFFHSFRIGERFVIAPTWEEVKKEKEEDILIRLDPGIAFGTGTHETTSLCLKELETYVKPEAEVLDVGCGSAILSIAAAKLGAKHLVALDIDEVAIKVAEENLSVNEVEKERVQTAAGNILEDKDLQNKVAERKYDVVVANILAPVLVPLTPVIVPVLKEGGCYITSGIVKERAKEVEDAIKKAGLSLVSKKADGDWICLTARK